MCSSFFLQPRSSSIKYYTKYNNIIHYTTFERVRVAENEINEKIKCYLGENNEPPIQLPSYNRKKGQVFYFSLLEITSGIAWWPIDATINSHTISDIFPTRVVNILAIIPMIAESNV